MGIPYISDEELKELEDKINSLSDEEIRDRERECHNIAFGPNSIFGLLGEACEERDKWAYRAESLGRVRRLIKAHRYAALLGQRARFEPFDDIVRLLRAVSKEAGKEKRSKVLWEMCQELTRDDS